MEKFKASTGIFIPLIAACCLAFMFWTTFQKEGVFPSQDSDCFLYINLAESDNLQWTNVDSECGRPVAWSPVVPVIIRALATIVPFEAAAMTSTILVLILAAPIAVKMAIRLSPSVGFMIYSTCLFLPSVIWTWSPGRPDHHAILTPVVILAALAMWREAGTPLRATLLGIVIAFAVWLSPMAAGPLLGFALGCAWLASTQISWRWLGIAALAACTGFWWFSCRQFRWNALETISPLWGMVIFSGCSLAGARSVKSWVLASVVAIAVATTAILVIASNPVSAQFLTLFASHIIEMQPPSATAWFGQMILPIAMVTNSIAFPRTNGHRLASLAMLLLAFSGLVTPQRLLAITAPLVFVAGFACSKEFRRQSIWVSVFFAQIAMGLAMAAFVVSGWSKSEDALRLAEFKKMKTVLPHGKRGITPIDDSIGLAQTTGTTCYGALFWENMPTLTARNELLKSSKNDIPLLIEFMVWPIAYTEECAWGGKPLSTQPPGWGDSLLSKLQNGSQIPGFKRLEHVFATRERAYQVYVRTHQ